MMVNSLNTNAQVFGPPRLLPQSWRWQNYVEIFQKQPFARHYANTLLVAGVGTLGNVLISALSGYGFARVRFPGRGILFILLLTALMMPVEVIIIPLFYQMKAWHLTDSLLPLIFLPVFCSQARCRIYVPSVLHHRAQGAGGGGPAGRNGTWRHLFRIMLPISVPVASSVGILAFLATWNMYLEPLVFTTSIDKYTLPLSLNNFNDVYWPARMAPAAGGYYPERHSRHVGVPVLPGKGDGCDGELRPERITAYEALEHQFASDPRAGAGPADAGKLSEDLRRAIEGAEDACRITGAVAPDAALPPEATACASARRDRCSLLKSRGQRTYPCSMACRISSTS